MALGTYRPINPFALPEQGSAWDALLRMSAQTGLSAPALEAETPAPPAPPPDSAAPTGGGGIWDWLTTPNQGSTGAQVLKSLILNLPFGASIGRGAQLRPMTAGQILAPAIQQKQNEQLWGAFTKSGLIPSDLAPAFQASGAPPTAVFPIVQQLAKTRAQDAAERRNAEQIRQQAARVGMTDLASSVPERISSQEAQVYWKEINDQLAGVRAQRREEAIAARQEQTQEAIAQRQQRQFEQQMRMQANQFAQSEKLQAIREAASAQRAANTARETDDRQLAMQNIRTYTDEANRYQSQIIQAEQERARGQAQLHDPVTGMLPTHPNELAQRKAEIDAIYRANIGPAEDARDVARMEARRLTNPVPPKQSRLTAEELQAKLAQTSHDKDYQKRLVSDVKKAIEQNAVVGITPEELIRLRREVMGGPR